MNIFLSLDKCIQAPVNEDMIDTTNTHVFVAENDALTLSTFDRNESIQVNQSNETINQTNDNSAERLVMVESTLVQQAMPSLIEFVPTVSRTPCAFVEINTDIYSTERSVKDLVKIFNRKST
jgi:hypothetical protein